MKGNQRQVSNERRRQSLRIRKPPVSNAKKGVAQKKNKKKSTPVREPSIHSLSVSSGSESEDMSAPSFEDINSVLVPTLGEEIMLARIIDEERDYDRQGSQSDTWNYWLNVKQKTIWWEELYELDQAARVFPKKKDKAKVELAEGSSSQTDLKGLEGRLVEFMGTAFASLNFTVEAKLESIDSRMSKMEERLTSIESKLSEEKNHGEDMDFRQWDHGNYGDYGTTSKNKGDKEEAGKSGEGEEEAEKSEGEGNKDKENSEADEENGDEQEQVLNRMKDDELWRSLMEDQEEVGGKVMEDQEEVETSEEVIENSQEEPMVEAEISEPRVAAEISEARVAAEINEPRVAAEISEARVAAEISEPRVAAEISEARVESPIKEPHFGSPIKQPHFESPIKEPRVEAHQITHNNTSSS
ncbi:putative serine/threonine-protein kinase kinX [Raphanus sativus]|nr:putative serine/threonine-protein kinase kinX [Raphanus sativus]